MPTSSRSSPSAGTNGALPPRSGLAPTGWSPRYFLKQNCGLPVTGKRGWGIGVDRQGRPRVSLGKGLEASEALEGKAPRSRGALFLSGPCEAEHKSLVTFTHRAE